MQGLVQIGDDITDILDPHRKPDQFGQHPRFDLLLLGQLAVGGAGGMQDAGAGVAQMNDQRNQLEVFYDLPTGLGSSFDAEGEYA
ncbi:hypothetical protein SDC9_185144 [bioreactor metagenome]|uniref:Uncharacterized protein n=1 Tax=bioreactor metagenome TaxID=1076179 RepID=A0A645HNE1_9ZZZZ